MKSSQILLCPSNRAGVNQSYTTNYYMMHNWANNPEAVGGPTGPADGGRTLASIPLPAQSPIYVDAVGISDTFPSLVFIANFANTTVEGRRLATTTTAAYGGTDPFATPHGSRHMEGANYSFADGHVKWLKGGATNPCCGTTLTTLENPRPLLLNTVGLDYDGDGFLGTAARID